MARWFLKNHDFIHVNSSVAGKYNKNKQDGSHLRFPIRMILATVDLKSPRNFQWTLSQLPFRSGEKVQNRFSRWTPWPQSGISYRNNLRYFYLQVTPMLPTKFQVNWPFSSEEEEKNRFSRWPPSWISELNNFSYFNIFIVIPMLPTNFQISWPFGSGK